MAKLIWALTLWLLVTAAPAGLVLAQENAEPETPAVEEGEQASAEGAEPDIDTSNTDIDPALFEDTELDEQTYEEDEDEFIPTEEIPADEPIPFPTNI